jgi:hypothetical protein
MYRECDEEGSREAAMVGEGGGGRSALFSVLTSLKKRKRVARPKLTVVRGKLFVMAKDRYALFIEDFVVAWHYCKNKRKSINLELPTETIYPKGCFKKWLP